MTIKNKKSPLKYAVMKDAPEEIIKSLINPSNFWGSLQQPGSFYCGFSHYRNEPHLIRKIRETIESKRKLKHLFLH